MEILESCTSRLLGVFIDACLEAVPPVTVDSDLLVQCLWLPGRPLLLDHDDPNDVLAELYRCLLETPVTKNDLDRACLGLKAPNAPLSLFSSLDENEAPATSMSVVDTLLNELVDVEAGEEGAKWILSVVSVDKLTLLQKCQSYKFRTFIRVSFIIASICVAFRHEAKMKRRFSPLPLMVFLHKKISALSWVKKGEEKFGS